MAGVSELGVKDQGEVGRRLGDKRVGVGIFETTNGSFFYNQEIEWQ